MRHRVRKRRGHARFKKGSLAAKRYMASIRPNRKRRRRKAGRVHHRRRRLAAPRVIVVRENKGAHMARRRRRPTTHRRRRVHRRRNPHTYTMRYNKRRRTRHHYRRNPSMRGIMGTVKTGVMDAAGIIAGVVAVRTIPKYIPGATQPGALGLAIQAGVAIAAGWAAHRFVGANFGRMVVAGGIFAVASTGIKAAGLPVLSEALAGDFDTSLAGYVQPGGVAGYVESGMGGIDTGAADEIDLMAQYG